MYPKDAQEPAGRFMKQISLERQHSVSVSRMPAVTLSVAVLPPVLGPVMMTLRSSGLTQMLMGTGGLRC